MDWSEGLVAMCNQLPCIFLVLFFFTFSSSILSSFIFNNRKTEVESQINYRINISYIHTRRQIYMIICSRKTKAWMLERIYGNFCLIVSSKEATITYCMRSCWSLDLIKLTFIKLWLNILHKVKSDQLIKVSDTYNLTLVDYTPFFPFIFIQFFSHAFRGFYKV